MIREETTSALAGFHAGPLSWSNWNSECWVLKREEKWSTLRKILGVRREPTINSTRAWHQTGIKPGPHLWEASALTTAPSLFPFL